MAAVQLLIVFGALVNVCAHLPPPCDSAVYCYGPLLHTVQVSGIFDDSKTFVDMKMRNDYPTTLERFEEFMVATNKTPTKKQIKTFVEDNFEEGNELEPWEPPDYKRNPNFLAKIDDPVLKDFGRQLVELWPVLARKVRAEVVTNSSRYSIIPVPNGFVVPGGRFKELYYWDSYWIIKGLLISDMNETALGMIDNFIHIVKTGGFIPNGARIYYLNRSQPPLLTKMATMYYRYSKNRAWLSENVQYLNQELQYWLQKKTVEVQKDGKTYTMARYDSRFSHPRPESYIEDFKAAAPYPDDEAKNELYIDIKSGAESGWDFSSRWIFDQTGGNLANISHIQTRRVIPVDLNAFLCEAFKSLSFLYSELGDFDNMTYWHQMGTQWQESIEEVLWDNVDGTWYDFDLKLSKPRKYFYPSNVAPLWAGCFDKHRGQLLGKRTLSYLSKVGVLDTPGGAGSSSIQSGEQWDFPNAWPPLQAMVVKALERSGFPEAVVAAKELATKWLMSNGDGYRGTGDMYEKYDVLTPGVHGGGGEYVVQSGFGWTNGVALQFIYDYFTDSNDLN